MCFETCYSVDCVMVTITTVLMQQQCLHLHMSVLAVEGGCNMWCYSRGPQL